MSYDLYLTSPSLTKERFVRFFEGRPHYQDAGWYANEDTGIYFSFQFSEGELAEELDDEEFPGALRGAHVAFNLNYFRPHVFGLEAEPELSAFISEFDCTIHDPQLDGMGDGPYSGEGFLRGWNAGNAFGYRAIAEQSASDDALVLDDAYIERVWRWNLQCAEWQEANPDGHFFPRVNWARRVNDGGPVAFAVWGEGVATAFPECATHALLAREPRRSFFGSKTSGMEVKLLPLETVAALTGCEWREGKAGRVLLAPASVPPSRSVTAAFEKGFDVIDTVVKAVSADHVLNASLMAQTKS